MSGLKEQIMGENGVGGRAVICPISCKSLHIILCFPLVGNVFISQSFPTFWHTSSSSSIILFAMINDFIIIVNKSLDCHVYLLFWRCVSGLLVYTLRFDRCTPECQSYLFMIIIIDISRIHKNTIFIIELLPRLTMFIITMGHLSSASTFLMWCYVSLN